MDSLALNPFRSIVPAESYQIHSASYSPSGSSVLVISRSTKPKLYNREGLEIGEFVAGDMYLVDMKNTKGHVAEITAGSWNPNSSGSSFATSSVDSTIRIWDVANSRSQKTVIVVRARGSSGPKTKVSTVGWSFDGMSVLGATIDGLLTSWDIRGPMTRPTLMAEKAHVPSSWTSCITAANDGTTIVTRGGDDTVKMWDNRKFSTPMMIRKDLANSGEENNITFSPDGRFLLTGTSAISESAPGQLHILDKSDLNSVEVLNFPSKGVSVSQTSWHSRTNQLLVGLSNGNVHAIFSRTASVKGAKSVVERAPKIRHFDDDPSKTTDISSMGLSEEALEMQTRLQRNRHKPEKNILNPKTPSEGVWGIPDSEHVKKNVQFSNLMTEDPREALLKYADQAERDPIFFKAYEKTQPKKIYAEVSGDEEEPPTKKSKQ